MPQQEINISSLAIVLFFVPFAIWAQSSERANGRLASMGPDSKPPTKAAWLESAFVEKELCGGAGQYVPLPLRSDPTGYKLVPDTERKRTRLPLVPARIRMRTKPKCTGRGRCAVYLVLGGDGRGWPCGRVGHGTLELLDKHRK